MDYRLIIFVGGLVLFLPLASMLIYVWHKYGGNDSGVTKARFIFLVGSLCIVGYILSL